MVTDVALLLSDPEWTSVVHDRGTLGLWLARGAEAAFGVVLLALIVRALVVERRYRARDAMNESDLAHLREALAAAERRTIGEIVPVVVERADDHPQAPWRAAALFFLGGTGSFAAALPWNTPSLLVLSQLGFGCVGFALATALRDFRRWFVTEARATEMAEEQAVIEFQRLGLEHTAARSGVLLFVALFERRAIVLADSGVAEKVDASTWSVACDRVLAGIRHGSLKDGLVDGIAEVGRVLAEHFPSKDGGRDEIPNRIIVRER